MKIETQPLEDHQVKLTVEVEPNLLEDAKQRAGRQLAKRIKIPGFRPGKAPYAMIVRQVGEAAIVEEATELLVNDIYPKAIDEAGIEPYGPGSLDKIVSMEPPVFEFVIPLKAEVVLGDYHSIRRPYEPKETTDEDVERVINDLRERQAVLEPIERPAEVGDMVYTRLNGQRKQAEEDKDPTLVKDRAYPVVIQGEEADTSQEWPFPGFSRQLIGMSVGDEKTITHTFSEDTEFESLRGVEAEFHVAVEDIKSRTLPELNDEFAQSVGDYVNMEDLRTKIRQDLENHEREAYNEDYDQGVIDEAANISDVKYPPQMLEHEIDSVIEQLKNRLSQQNLDLDLYLKTRQMDMNALREESRPVAEARLKKTLVLLEISEAEQIKIAPDELQEETTRTLNVMARVLPEKEARKLNDREVVSSLVGNIMMDMITNRTTERLRDIAQGKIEQETSTAEEESVTAAESETAPTAEEASTEPAKTATESPAEPVSEENETPPEQESSEA